jgi:predicted metal-binding membrane protein
MSARSRPFTAWFDRLRQPYRRGYVPLGLLTSLVLLTGAAWWLTIDQAARMSMPMGVAVRGGMAGDHMAGDHMAGDHMVGMAMGGISASGWSIQGAIGFVAIWTVMMAAMMLPAAAPMIFMFASAQARRDPHVAVPTWVFVAGYMLVWAAAGAVVYAVVQIASEFATDLTVAERGKWAPVALGSTIVAAGLYQFTPVKRLCLDHCRSPFGFIARHWRDGRGGALAMGLRHGAYCLGCCWALFAVLVAAGVMSLAWMLLLTLVVIIEKMLPRGRLLSAAVGIALIGLGILVASGAATMPGGVSND